MMNNPETIKKLEMELLFQAVHTLYGYDFRHYAPDSARRRVIHRMQIEEVDSIGALQNLILHSKSSADSLLKELSVNVTEMFRDPFFFRFLRDTVLPLFNDQAGLKIWHAGCANGMEAYSMAILLTEQESYYKSIVYATDFNRSVLQEAKTGIYPIDLMSKNIQNYQLSGGEHPFSDYYHAKFGNAAIADTLKKNILFAHHNLTCDASFGEMDMIVCRNVIIYFDRTLQDRVFRLFWESLRCGGILCLGSCETLQLSSTRHHFSVLSKEHKIYQKIS